MSTFDKLNSAANSVFDAFPETLPEGVTVSVRLFVNVAYPVNGVEQTESVTFENPYDVADFSAKVAEIGKRVQAAIKALPKE